MVDASLVGDMPGIPGGNPGGRSPGGCMATATHMRLRSLAESVWPSFISQRARLNNLTVAKLAEEAMKLNVDPEVVDRSCDGMDPRGDLIREIIQTSRLENPGRVTRIFAAIKACLTPTAHEGGRGLAEGSARWQRGRGEARCGGLDETDDQEGP